MRVVTRKIVGYDRDAEIVVFEYPIPQQKWPDALSIVRNNENDPDYVYNYQLDANQSDKLLGMIGKQAFKSLKYFLECERRA